MKSYTDIEQSKRLAEILPLESADNYYSWHDEQYYVVNKDCPYPYSLKEKIPCWSLAALMDLLPIVYINNKKEVCGPLHIDITDSETPFVLWYVNPLHKGNIVEIQTKEYDNMIDACVEMIVKLNELKML